MRVAAQKTAELTQLGERLEGMRSTMLTMQDAQGHLSSQPMTVLEMDSEGDLWMLISKSGQTARQAPALEGLSTVCLAFSDESSSTYVSVTANASVQNDRQRKEDLWSPMARPWFPEGVDDPDLAVLRLQPVKAEIWDGSDSSVVRFVAMASSVVMGKPVGAGDHKKLSLGGDV